ncbi:MAG: thiolase family protein [Deltaproteobacteria bacterium]|nr:thiolase family protein [Deltaproteobacteria bacterium]
MSKGDFAVIGTGEVPCGFYPERSEYEIAYTVARMAVQDAGIDMKEVGAVLSAAHIMGSEYNTEIFFGHLPEAIGAKNCRNVATTVAGGGSSFAIRRTAEGILASGETDTVLVIHAQRFSQFSTNDQIKYFAHAGSNLEWEIPYGMTYNALAAMMSQAYINYTGTTLEQVAAQVVACRKWANLQPNAMFYSKTVTVEQVLKSRRVAYPLTALMCNVLADGGCAYVLTTAEKARKVCPKPVYLLGEASDYSHRNLTNAKSSFRNLAKMHEFYAPVARRAFERAGLGPEEMDIFQIYAAYPALALAMMDALGFVEPGRSGALVASGETGPGGKFPCTTNGEALGFGHTGTGVGFALFVESVRQLQGKAGRAQVPNAKFLIENCGGGAWMDVHFSVLGNEIP